MDALIELIDNFALMKLIIVRLPFMNPFNTNVLFLYPTKKSKPEVFWRFKGHKNRKLAWNRLNQYGGLLLSLLEKKE